MNHFHASLLAILFSIHCAALASEQPLIPKPQIPDRTFKVTAFGAIGDGKTINTQAISRAIDACSKAGGGTVLVPAGVFLTGPITLASNLDFEVPAGATLLITNDTHQFQKHGNGYESCIVADNCHDLAITGKGTIDGQGASWWADFLKAKKSPAGAAGAAHRPYLLVLNQCTRVLVEGITLTNSPSFHLVPRACREVTIDSVQFRAPANSPNTDGLDPSGWNYLITRCTFDVGDDCIAIKPSGESDSSHLSCEDFKITECTFLHGHGLSIGGQTPGGLRRLTVRDCTFDHTDAGIRMKAGRGSGGIVEDLLYENLKMTQVKVPIFITSYYPRLPEHPADDPAQSTGSKTPIWRHIRISNLTSDDSPIAGRIIGLPEMPVQDMVLTNVHISAVKGMEIVHAKGIRFVESSIAAAEGPPINAHDADTSGL